MEIGLNTDFWKEYETVEEMEESLRMIAAAGFTHIHWCYEWSSDYIYAASEMRQIREWMDKYQLRAKSLHATHGRGAKKGLHARKDYLSPIEHNRLAGVDLIKNRVELVHALGGSEIVLHMYLPYEDFQNVPGAKEDFYTRACKSLDDLMPFCLEKGVRICLENLFEAPAEMQIEQFGMLFDRYPAEFLGLCLDTGHANLVWGNAFITKLAERFGDRLYSIHMHDNKGWGKEPGCGDAHMVPGDGNIDWKSLMAVLRKTAYQAPWVLELSKPEGEEPESYLHRAYKAAEWMVSL